jgi:chemotaxis protein MotB
VPAEGGPENAGGSGGIDGAINVEQQPIIVVKKKSAQHGHHGGAWKVAYADFVTALMSLFIVLWLMNCNKSVQDAVGGYFRDPYGAAKKVGHDKGAGEPVAPKREDLNKVKADLLRALESLPDFQKLKDQIEITVTDEGLLVELMEQPKGTFFENGKSDPTPILSQVLVILSQQTGKLPNPVSIEGHTDSKPFSNSKGYGNWELSSDRANAARRLMEADGLHSGQVAQVRGYADRQLRKPQQPEDASNRRISILVHYMGADTHPTAISNGSMPQAVPLLKTQ